jgi:uncharacterized protein
MVDYQYPGVYVEEMPPLARPIAGVGTSTAGFIGVVMDDVKMPTKPDGTGKFEVCKAGKPQLITGWEQFKNNFGDFQSKKDAGLGDTPSGGSDDDYKAYLQLQHAVYGFFNNGGTRCWVIRVAKEDDLKNLAKFLKEFESIDEIAIVAAPGVTDKDPQNAISNHCEDMKDRVAILDGKQTDDFTVVSIQGGSTSDYAALYFPWIKVFNPDDKKIISQPPSGHLAGVYARVDAERGVYKAPANELIRGAVDLEHRLSPLDQKVLNPKGINVIRDFNGNFNIWGARTLGGEDNPTPYISTRRYLNYLRKSIEQGTQFVVFEPNNSALWQRIIRTISDFLLRQWRNGALFGDTPKQAFYVKCDKDTNPPDVRELGQVVTEIGVAIVKPAEFVIFRIQQTTGE